jgi:RIO kinase 1
MWAEKEARNLSRMHEAGIRCPKPLLLRNHILAMTFIGRDSKVSSIHSRHFFTRSNIFIHSLLQAAPRLRDADVSEDKWPQLYAEVPLLSHHHTPTPHAL